MIEDKALAIITRGPITWDGLRAELGCSPGELDEAVRHLETAKSITRDRGRLRLDCRECKNRLARERRAAKLAQAQSASAPAVPPAVLKAAVARTPVVILHLPDGIRVGPAVTSAAGVLQMPYHVDLTGEQLDEICAWWTNCKRGAA